MLAMASEFDAAVQGRIADPVVRQQLLEQLPKTTASRSSRSGWRTGTGWR